MTPVGPDSQLILDYSVADAARAGFGKIVFVIRREMEEAFKSLTLAKYEDLIELAYAFQETEDIPFALPNLQQRKKPFGTGHAVYAARHHLQTPFAVINADDFYGSDAFATLSTFLQRDEAAEGIEHYGLVGYKLKNTLSRHGAVSRGVCRSGASGELLSIEEHTEIAYRDDGKISGLDSEGVEVALDANTMVSLNCWAFPAGWASRLEPLLVDFLKERGQEANSEFYLPSAVDELIHLGQAKAAILPSESRWLGVTFREDLKAVRKEIASLHARGDY